MKFAALGDTNTLTYISHFIATSGGKGGFRVRGDCMEGAGICDGDIVAADFTRFPRPQDTCVCYGRPPAGANGVVMVKRYDGVMFGRQMVSTQYRQEPGNFRMNRAFTPEAILGIVYAVYGSDGACKWESDPDTYPTTLPTASPFMLKDWGNRFGWRCATSERKLLSEKECKEGIACFLANIHDAALLNRIYNFVQYLYLHN